MSGYCTFYKSLLYRYSYIVYSYIVIYLINNCTLQFNNRLMIIQKSPVSVCAKNDQIIGIEHDTQRVC